MVTIIAATSKNNIIGYKNKLPWSVIREDFRQFRAATLKHTVIMGRNTFNSIGNRPLVDRVNIILSTTLSQPEDNSFFVRSKLSDAIEFSQTNYPEKQIYIIGGEGVYREGMTIADQLRITKIDCEFPGDAYFPEIDLHKWEQISFEILSTYPYPATLVIYNKIK